MFGCEPLSEAWADPELGLETRRVGHQWSDCFRFALWKDQFGYTGAIGTQEARVEAERPVSSYYKSWKGLYQSSNRGTD